MGSEEIQELRQAIEKASAAGHERLNLPKPNKVPPPPKELPSAARKIWRRVAPEVAARGRLAPGDLDQFALYCDTLAKLWQASEALGVGPLLPGWRDEYRTNPVWKVYRELHATARTLGADFGLTPGARSRLRAAGSANRPESHCGGLSSRP